MLVYTSEFSQSDFTQPPEALDAVYMIKML